MGHFPVAMLVITGGKYLKQRILELDLRDHSSNQSKSASSITLHIVRNLMSQNVHF